MPVLMKISALGTNVITNVDDACLQCTEFLFKELFTWAQQTKNISTINNNLLINLGLIKVKMT